MESTMSEELLFDTCSAMESLPTEILEKILGYLPAKERIRAERVCKRWKNISTNEVWKDVEILRVSEEVNTGYIRIDLLSKIIQIPSSKHYEQSIESIELRPEKIFINFNESKIVRSLLSRCGKNVKELIFDLCLSNETSGLILTIIATYCQNIEEFRFHERPLPCREYISVSHFGEFLWLLQVNNQLQSITCSCMANIVEILPLKNWKSLYISFPSLTKEWENKIIALIENSPSLENLKLMAWTTNMLVATSDCKQLKTLILSTWFPEPDQNDIMTEVPLMNNLKDLACLFQPGDEEWNFSFQPGDEGGEKNSIALINNSPSLEKLEVHHWTTNILAAISRCKQLKSLTVTTWHREPVRDLNDVRIEIPSLNNLKFLKWKDLDGQRTHDDQIIDLLRHHCINLEELHIHCWRGLDHLPLELEQAILALPKLNSLKLSGLSITYETLSRFAQKLKYFGFSSYCTQDGIFEMIMNSECLEELHCIERITVESIRRLVENTRERRKILKISVDDTSREMLEMLEICRNSKIHLIPQSSLDWSG